MLMLLKKIISPGWSWISMARRFASICSASRACRWVLVRAGSDLERGAEGVPVMRAREQLIRTRPDVCSGYAIGLVSKV